MSELLDCVWLHWPETRALAQAIAPLRFVGGCVRDGLLERKVSDVDAATPLPPQDVMARLQAAGHKVVPTGIDHGTVTAVIGGRHFEITTLRRDVETDGRHAVVAFTDDWREDASRRDFTMNALYCDAEGRVYDYFDGAADARKGRVRFIGDARARIGEDALRILRFFRFYAHYGQGAIDAEGLAACGEMADKVAGLSGERIAAEMLNLLAARRAAQVVGLMQRHDIWPFLVPVTVQAEALDRLPELVRKAQGKPDGLLALALLLRSMKGDKHALTQTVSNRWKLSGAHAKRLAALCAESVACHADEAQWKRAIRALGKALFTDHMLLTMAEGAEESCGLAAIALAGDWEPLVFPVTGDDLIARGIRPGKELGEQLKKLEAQWEASEYRMSKETLLFQNL